MRIAELVCRHVRIPLKRTVKHASHERTSTDSLVVSCRLDNGSIGWGEGLPREYVTGDTIEADLRLFEETDWRETLGEQIESLADAVAMTGRIQFSNRETTQRDCFGNPLKCAIELAVLDAVCRTLNVPLSQVAYKVPEVAPLIRPRKKVQYSGVITSTSLKKVKKYARIYRWTGFRHCKLKVGTEGIDDVELLVTARRFLGNKIAIRVDANEAWTCENVVAKLAPLNRFGIVAIEQPVPHEQVGGLSAIKSLIEIPIMLDESLCSWTDAQRAIEQRYCDVFNIRLSKCGGFVDSLKLAALARNSGLQFQLGCQVGETGILSAAGRHFASTIDGYIAAEGSFENYLVAERLTQENLTFGWAGKAPAIERPGLGVTIDPAALARVQQAEHRVSFE